MDVDAEALVDKRRARCDEHAMSTDSRRRVARHRNVAAGLKRLNECAANAVPYLLQGEGIRVNLVDCRERAAQTARRRRDDLSNVPVKQLHAKRLRPKEEKQRPESESRAS